MLERVLTRTLEQTSDYVLTDKIMNGVVPAQIGALLQITNAVHEGKKSVELFPQETPVTTMYTGIFFNEGLPLTMVLSGDAAHAPDILLAYSAVDSGDKTVDRRYSEIAEVSMFEPKQIAGFSISSDGMIAPLLSAVVPVDVVRNGMSTEGLTFNMQTHPRPFSSDGVIVPYAATTNFSSPSLQIMDRLLARTYHVYQELRREIDDFFTNSNL